MKYTQHSRNHTHIWCTHIHFTSPYWDQLQLGLITFPVLNSFTSLCSLAWPTKVQTTQCYTLL